MAKMTSMTKEEKEREKQEALKRWNQDSEEEDNLEEEKNVPEEQPPGKIHRHLDRSKF